LGANLYPGRGLFDRHRGLVANSELLNLRVIVHRLVLLRQGGLASIISHTVIEVRVGRQIYENLVKETNLRIGVWIVVNVEAMLAR
jgi:hypothetical protein